MKHILFLVLVILVTGGYSQVDSTTVKYGYIENEDLRLITQIEDIKFAELIFSDTLLYGKKIFISINEYLNGEIIREDSLGFTCEDEEIPVVVDGDTVYYRVNMCDRLTFTKPLKNFKIKIAGKTKNDTFNLFIRYPSIMVKRKLKAGENYSLRPFQGGAKNEAKIPLNRKVPIFIYTPPYKVSGGNFYCILDGNSIDSIYKKYKIEHYYIFFLEIK